MTMPPIRRRAHLFTASAAVTVFALTGCGDGDAPTETGASAKAGLADFTGGTLYDAITYARENDLSYTAEDTSGDAVDVENTREYVVVEQDPESGTEIQPRDSVTLVIEAAE